MPLSVVEEVNEILTFSPKKQLSSLSVLFILLNSESGIKLYIDGLLALIVLLPTILGEKFSAASRVLLLVIIVAAAGVARSTAVQWVVKWPGV